MNKNPVISVAIIGLNEEKLVGKCLQSLVDQDISGQFEVVYIDGMSKDNTVKIVKSFDRLLSIKILRYAARSIGDARQKAFSLTHADIIASTDSDVVLPKNWLRTIYEHFLKHPKCDGVVGPYMLDSFSPNVQLLLSRLLVIGDFIIRIIVGFFPFRGLNFAVRRNSWIKSGGFERSISALEDVDLALKVSKIGRICYLPNLTIYTAARRFKGKIIVSNTIYRLMAFYHRVYLRDYTQYKDWKRIRE